LYYQEIGYKLLKMVDNIHNTSSVSNSSKLDVSNTSELDTLSLVAGKIFHLTLQDDISKGMKLISKILSPKYYCDMTIDDGIDNLSIVVNHLNEKYPEHSYHNRWLFNEDTRTKNFACVKWEDVVIRFYQKLMDDDEKVYSLNNDYGWLIATVVAYKYTQEGKYVDLFIHLREKRERKGIDDTWSLLPYYFYDTYNNAWSELNTKYEEYKKQQTKENEKRELLSKIQDIEKQLVGLRDELDNLKN